MKLQHILQLAGLLHLGLIAAGAVMPHVVSLRSHLAELPKFIRRLFWVYYAFIGYCLVSFGLFTFIFAGTLAEGTPMARAVCAFLAIFWTLRWMAATFVFDVRPYLTNHYRRLGYHATNVAFVFLPLAYGWAAWRGGLP